MIELPEQERGALGYYDSRLEAVRTHWVITGEADLALELVKERIGLLHTLETNSVDRALRGRSHTHLASATIQLGEIPEVRIELRRLLKELEADTTTQIKFIADELDRIEKWQKASSLRLSKGSQPQR